MKKINHIFFLYFIIFCFAKSIGQIRIDTTKVFSASMNKMVPNLVVLPDSYDTQKEKCPVIYLLHGAGGDYKYWLDRNPEIKKYVNDYNIILVCPDAGNTSWYFDSLNDSSMRYETYISKELVLAIDKQYNTLVTRQSRAIIGGSMGGHGAFFLSFRNLTVWGAAGSMSGGLDLRPFSENWDISKRLGSYATNKEVWNANSVINMVYLIGGSDLELIFDCGTSDFFYDANKRMHQKLLERNIPHTYIERPGVHNTKYWAEALKYQFFFMNNFFKS